MHGELIQFNSGDHVLGNKNVTEAVITDGDIVFNESYVVIGESLMYQDTILSACDAKADHTVHPHGYFG